MRLCFFFNDTATTEIYTLSLHDALPIWGERTVLLCAHLDTVPPVAPIEPVLVDDGWENAHAGILGADNKAAVAMLLEVARRDRKSTRLNSSHANISYAVFCLKKKKTLSK